LVDGIATLIIRNAVNEIALVFLVVTVATLALANARAFGAATRIIIFGMC
jgi:hypothetical protein